MPDTPDSLEEEECCTLSSFSFLFVLLLVPVEPKTVCSADGRDEDAELKARFDSGRFRPVRDAFLRFHLNSVFGSSPSSNSSFFTLSCRVVSVLLSSS